MIYEPQHWLEYIFIFSDHPINAERGHYVTSLVLLSYLVATIGAFTSLKVIKGLFEASSEVAQRKLHVIGALCLAATIWSMHFVGMLAYDMDMVHSYNVPLTFLSMVIAAAVAYGFIAIVRFLPPRILTYGIGAVLLGTAICAMHYSGMLAMEMDAWLLYKPKIFMLSVLIAFVASAGAMFLVYTLKKTDHIFWFILSSIVIGVAICGMHYTGMAATIFIPFAECRFAPDQTYFGIALMVTLLSGGIYIASFMLKNAILSSSRNEEQRHWGSYIPVVVFIVGIVIITISVSLTEDAIKRQKQEKFKDFTAEITNGILDKYTLYEQILRGGIGLYEASEYISAQEWKQFISAQNIEENLPSISGVGFIKYLKEQELAEFLEQYNAETGLPFKNHPNTEFDEKFIIKYIEPAEANAKAIGLDIGFEKHRREAALESIRTGKPTLTRRIELVQDEKTRAGFLLLFPYFEYATPQDALMRKNAQIYGWVYAPFIADNFLRDLRRIGKDQVVFAVYDGQIQDENTIIFKDPLFESQNQRDHLLKVEIIEIAGRPWTIELKSTKNFSNELKSYLPLWVIVVGLLLTALLSLMIYTQNTRARVIESLVERKTKELQDLSESLEETVKHRTHALEKANKAKDMFLANMSHELRTPLNSIIGLVRILIKEKDMPKEHVQTLEVVNKSSSNLLEIVNDVLDMSKIEAEMIELEETPFKLKTLLTSLEDQLKPLASQKGLTLKGNIAELDNTYVVGDELRVSRILLNLGSNAVKYTPSGEVSINAGYIKRSADKIIFECSISDTGIGIREDKIEHIFDKFTQAEESTARKFGGTGLGLNITKQLVKLMNGTIDVQSTPDKGSVFTVKIPFKVAHAEDLVNYKKDNAHKAHSVNQNTQTDRMIAKDAHVLIAEDHEFNQIFILKLLKQFGFENTHLVTNGKDAVKAFKKDQYDIVLMDCHMPKLNGYDATKQIRASEKDDQHTPIFAMTADAMHGTRERCIEAGMDEYITKPVDSDILLEYLQNYFILEASQQSETEQDVNVQKNALINLDVLMEYTDGNMEDTKELIGIFCEKTAQDLKKLEENITDGENEDWSMIAHGLKGSAAYIGATQLSGLAAQAQDMKTATLKERQEKFDEIEAIYKKIYDTLKEQGLI